ncbi:MAG: transferrin-binding protein-like solute binding protein [Caulobacteraceae bacterium]
MDGAVESYSKTISGSSYTETGTAPTPGGSITAGWNNANETDGLSQGGATNVIEFDATVTASTDPAVAVGAPLTIDDYADSSGLTYAQYGTWTVNPSGSNTNAIYIAVFAGGLPGVAETSSMPTTGSATYTGGAVGVVLEPGVTTSGADAGQWFGNSSLTANFATGAVTGSITGINVFAVNSSGGNPPNIGTLNDIGLTATISGSAYDGTADVTGTAGTAFDITGATGNTHGAFFGPSAAETAGVFYLTGGTNNVSVEGSFGASAPVVLNSSLFSEVGTIGGSAPNFTFAVDPALDGAVLSLSAMETSGGGYSATANVQTPGGGVTASWTNADESDNISNEVGQSGVTEDDATVASSTDSAVAVGDPVTIDTFGVTSGLQYTSYGTWNVNTSGSNSTPIYFGVFGGGAPGVSETSSMPTTGSATYTGGAVGLVLEPGATSSGADAGQWFGNSSLTANFSTGSVTGSVTGINVFSVATNTQTNIGTLNDIGLTATISGAAYAGATNVTGPAGTAFDITGATGKVHGAFYGPNAAETAGAFYLTGGTNNVSVVGAFGAKQAPSDRRLKTEIEPAGTTAQGLQIYSWRYLGGERRFTGVIAQDLLADPRFVDAVEIAEDGLMVVDYARIGFDPPDFEAMVREGRGAIDRYRARQAQS